AAFSKARLVRPALVAFGLVLVVFALVRSPAGALVIAPILGYAYFVVITSLSTVLQEHVDDAVRGRVMGLWIMGFGGTVPVGVLIAGPLASVTSITFVLLIGAVVAVALAGYANLVKVGAPG
ncbi:MAG: MFS transporter, partial [Acidimicrobiia bacterium]|nr:MFS transporter [Acidimicrobiia bacterium]